MAPGCCGASCDDAGVASTCRANTAMTIVNARSAIFMCASLGTWNCELRTSNFELRTSLGRRLDAQQRAKGLVGDDVEQSVRPRFHFPDPLLQFGKHPVVASRRQPLGIERHARDKLARSGAHRADKRLPLP